MTSHEPPVYMDEDDDQSCFHSHMNTATEEASVSYLFILYMYTYLLVCIMKIRVQNESTGFSNYSYSSENVDFFSLTSQIYGAFSNVFLKSFIKTFLNI